MAEERITEIPVVDVDCYNFHTVKEKSQNAEQTKYILTIT